MSSLRQVTKDEFWRWVMGTKRNVHPSVRGSSKDADGYVSLWHDQRTGQLLGKSTDRTGVYELIEDAD